MPQQRAVRRYMPLLLVVCCAAAVLQAQTKRRIGLSDLPAAWPAIASEEAVGQIEQRSARRLREGENEHLIAYVLQSSQFTTEPRIEPGVSALEFFRDGQAAQQLPASVARRMDAFLKAKPHRSGDPRLAYFQKLAAAGGKAYLESEYVRTMRFLYEKERGQQQSRPPAGLYQERGYATDTQIEANFAVWTAMSVLKSLDSTFHADRILIVGPGLDLAPRTGLLDFFPPQSYQPLAAADAALSLGLTNRERLHVHSVDINPLAVEFFNEFPRRSERKLNLVSGLKRDQLSADFQDYFQQLGKSIGTVLPLDLPPALVAHFGKTIAVRKDVAGMLTADEMNILTERYDPSPGYDLIVATNILVYFTDEELRLALANIAAMLRRGGYFVHNEPRPAVEAMGRDLGLAAIQARTIRLSAGSYKPLLDSFVIQQLKR